MRLLFNCGDPNASKKMTLRALPIPFRTRNVLRTVQDIIEVESRIARISPFDNFPKQKLTIADLNNLAPFVSLWTWKFTLG